MKRVVKKSGYPERVVRHLFLAQTDAIRSALAQGEAVYFRTLFKLVADEREISVQSPKNGRHKVRKVILKVKPTRMFRHELNKWLPEEKPMDKFAVALDKETSKTAANSVTCPSCGGKDVRMSGETPICAKCGTAPFEPQENRGKTRQDNL